MSKAKKALSFGRCGVRNLAGINYRKYAMQLRGNLESLGPPC